VQGQPCGITDGTNQYDLSPLTSSLGYSGKDSATPINSYLFNFCGPVTAPKSPCGNAGDPPAAVQTTEGGNCVPTGRLPNYKVAYSASTGLSLTYDNPADRCAQNTIDRMTVINIKCDASVETFVVDTIAEDKTCEYVISGRSRYGCAKGSGGSGGSSGGGKPEGSKLSGGWVFIIILLSVSVLYFVVGGLIKWRTGATGVEMIPNHSFWTDLPALVKDGFGFVRSKATGYQSV